jgi:hypothetical protein
LGHGEFRKRTSNLPGNKRRPRKYAGQQKQTMLKSFE